jgi:hypothetical protein
VFEASMAAGDWGDSCGKGMTGMKQVGPMGTSNRGLSVVAHGGVEDEFDRRLGCRWAIGASTGDGRSRSNRSWFSITVEESRRRRTTGCPIGV